MTTAAVKATTNGNGRIKPELLSIQKIAFRVGLDRATCRKRLDALGYTPEKEESKLKLYRFDADMDAALTESQDKLTDVRIRKETAAARLNEMKVLQQEGELIAVTDVEDYLQRLFKALYQEAVVRMPKRIASTLAKKKTAAEVNDVLNEQLGKIFLTVREDHGQLLVNGRKTNK